MYVFQELTGELPKETPLAPGEQIPTFRRRVGTSFSLSAKAVSGTDEVGLFVMYLVFKMEIVTMYINNKHCYNLKLTLLVAKSWLFSVEHFVVDTSDLDLVLQREDQLAKMELEYELQSKITSAAHKLAQDKAVGKNVRKQRRQSYNRALQKVCIG